MIFIDHRFIGKKNQKAAKPKITNLSRFQTFPQPGWNRMFMPGLCGVTQTPKVIKRNKRQLFDKVCRCITSLCITFLSNEWSVSSFEPWCHTQIPDSWVIAVCQSSNIDQADIKCIEAAIVRVSFSPPHFLSCTNYPKVNTAITGLNANWLCVELIVVLLLIIIPSEQINLRD